MDILKWVVILEFNLILGNKYQTKTPLNEVKSSGERAFN